MLNLYLNFDQQITNYLNVLLPHHNLLDFIFNFFSTKFGSIGIWITVLLPLVLFAKKIDKRKLIIYLLTISLITAGLTQIIKHAVKRDRPAKTFSYSRVSSTCNKPNNYSFPSGHTSSALAAAATFAYFDKKRKYFYYLVAGLIGLSRIYLQCHYAFDVMAGGLLGYFIAYSSLKFVIKKK